jgi:hypothetical protein
VHKRQRCSGEDGVHELVTSLPVLSLMARVVQFNTGDRSHGGRVAQEEIHVLLRDPTSGPLVLIWARDEHDVAEIHLWTDNGLSTNGCEQCPIERQLGWRQEVVSHSIWEFANRGRRFLWRAHSEKCPETPRVSIA